MAARGRDPTGHAAARMAARAAGELPRRRPQATRDMPPRLRHAAEGAPTFRLCARLRPPLPADAPWRAPYPRRPREQAAIAQPRYSRPGLSGAAAARPGPPAGRQKMKKGWT